MIGTRCSTAFPLLMLPLSLLASCGQQPGPPPAAKAAQSEIDEVHALVQAVKDNPSVKDPSLSGKPIHVDPFPHSAGVTHASQPPMKHEH